MEYEYFVTEMKFGMASYRQVETMLNSETITEAGWEFVCFTPLGNGVYRKERHG